MRFPVWASHSRTVLSFQTSPTCEGIPIGTERYAIDLIRMPGEGTYAIPRVGIPQSNSIIITPTCEGIPIGTERYAPERIRMPGEGTYEIPRVGIPQSNSIIITCTCEG